MYFSNFLSYSRFGSGITLYGLDVEWLGLTSLKKVWNGAVLIVSNSHLCYIEDLDLSPILAFPYQEFILADNKGKAECGKYKTAIGAGHKCFNAFLIFLMCRQ
jgi:hypothetical protein